MKKRTKWGIGCGAAAAIVAGAVIAVLALLFESVRLFPLPELKPEDLTRQSEVIDAVAGQLQDAAARPGEPMTFRLTPAQVRAVLRISLRQHAFREGVTELPLQLDYRDDGRWELAFMYDTERRWIFGGGLRIVLIGRLSIREGLAAFAADSVAVGSVRLTGATAQWLVDPAMEEINGDDRFADFADAIREFYAEETGDLIVSVEPGEIFWLIETITGAGHRQ